jgi:hypothetical protein
MYSSFKFSIHQDSWSPAAGSALLRGQYIIVNKYFPNEFSFIIVCQALVQLALLYYLQIKRQI